MSTSNLLVELSTEDQELLSGGRRKGCYKKCYWICPKSDRYDRDRDRDRDDDDDDK